MSWSDVQSFKSCALDQWEATSKFIPKRDWTIKYRGLSLDFTAKARQNLAPEYERLLLLQKIARQMAATSTVRIVECAQFRYLKKIDPSSDFSGYPRLPIVSEANVLFDFLFNQIYTLAQTLRLIQELLLACLSKDRHQPLQDKCIPLIWDGVDQNQLTLNPKLRSFTWIIDGKDVRHEDVLFLLPRNSGRKFRTEFYESDYQAFTFLEIYRRVPSRILFRCALALALFSARTLFSMPHPLRSTEKGTYFASIIRMEPVIECVKPTCYVTNVSRVGIEDPSTIYLNETGVRTIMYCYSANSHDFSDMQPDGDFRSVMFENILASQLVVWNENYKDFVQKHSQENTAIQIIGPLMEGDESVCRSTAVTLRNGLGIRETDSRRRFRYVSIFDVPTITKSETLRLGLFPMPYTEEYALNFFRDMMKLWDEFNDIVLVFKPKRDMINERFSHHDEYREFVEKLRNSERGLVLDDNINPWIPVAISDLCIAMPFTSPPLAAMHYGIQGLFHDPTGIAIHHEYQEIDNFTTHDYDQLRFRVGSLISGSSEGNAGNEPDWSQCRKLIGIDSGTTPTARFRKLLMGNAKGETSDTPLESRLVDLIRR